MNKETFIIIVGVILQMITIILTLVYVGVVTPLIKNNALAILAIIGGLYVALFIVDRISKGVDHYLKKLEDDE